MVSPCSGLRLQACSELRHVLALVPAQPELQRSRHARAVADAGNTACAVRSATGDLAHRGQLSVRIRQPDDDHSVMQQRQVEGGDRRLLPPCWLAVLQNTLPILPTSAPWT